MPTIAELMAASGLESSQKYADTVTAGATGAQMGAQLVQTIQNTQKQRADLETQKQQLQLQKLDRIGSLYETAGKLDGKAQRFMYDKAIPNTINALGLNDFFPEATQSLLSSNSYAVPYLMSQVRQDPAKFDEIIGALKDPTGESLGKLFPAIKEFGSLQEITSEIDDQRKTLEDAQKFGLTAQAGMQRAQILGNPRAAATQTAKDEQSAKATERITNDATINMLTKNAQRIHTDLSTLAAHPSNMVLKEIAQAIPGLLSGSNVSSDFKVKEVSPETIQGKIADVVGFATSNPNQPAPPEVVRFFNDMLVRLDGAHQRQIAARARIKSKEAKTIYKGNPSAIEAVESTAQSYIDGTWSGKAATYDVRGRQMSADQIKNLPPAAQKLLPDDIKKAVGIK